MREDDLGELAWGALLLAALVLEGYGVRHPGRNGTLSEFTRRTFFTHTTTGRLVFAGSWAAFSAWYLKHILRATTKGTRHGERTL